MTQRLKTFRLADVPEPVRERAADRYARSAATPEDALFVRLAARAPSGRVYAVSRGAWERAVGGTVRPDA